MFLSLVSNTWKPAASAAFSKSPFESLSHPRSRASTTTCPTSARAMPLGVPWSKRTSIGGRGRRDGSRRRIQAAGCKFEHGPDLFLRHMKLFHDFLNAGARFEILKNRGHGHPGAAKHPTTAAPAGHAFHCRALRPVNCGHGESPFFDFSTERTMSRAIGCRWQGVGAGDPRDRVDAGRKLEYRFKP